MADVRLPEHIARNGSHVQNAYSSPNRLFALAKVAQPDPSFVWQVLALFIYIETAWMLISCFTKLRRRAWNALEMRASCFY